MRNHSRRRNPGGGYVIPFYGCDIFLPARISPMTQKRIIGIIPARYGSSRLPGKALRRIHNKTMVQRVYERSLLCPRLNALYVATDDERIVSTVEAFGGQAVMTLMDCQSGTERAAEAMASIEADIVVNIQGDQPFIDPLMIDECIQPMLDDDTLPMCTLMHPISHPEDLLDPAVVKVVVDLNGNALYFSRSLIPCPSSSNKNRIHRVYEHIGLYVYTKAFLLQLAALPSTPLEQVESLEQLRVLEHGYRLRVVETKTQDNAFYGFSVDTEQDLVRAETMLCERHQE